MRLDRQQIEAVVACEDAQLVLASAGSGKTMSLLAKVEYLVCQLHIKPEQILVISFTKKTVAELEERCAISGVEIRTFHSLGNTILHKNGETGTLISDEEAYSFLNQSKYITKLGETPELLRTFLTLHKNSGLTIDEISCRLQGNSKFTERAENFLKTYREILRDYERYLNKKCQYDFSDMINRATEYIRKGPPQKYRYILLDEVQDLSPNRARLIKALLDKSENCRLFAVGDDWQSIYRFAGSDLSLIRNFADVFGRHTRRSLIETTHRFGRPTTSISSDFILQNKLQMAKSAHAKRRRKTPVKVVLSRDLDNDVEALEQIIAYCGKKYLKEREVQIISRYNSDIERLKSPNIITRSKGSGVYDVVWRGCLHFEFCSMHKSKGITRDIVIVLNMNSSKHGMPATQPVDPLIDVLLAPEEDFAFAEERRLFYVAITRAREQTFLIANAKRPSPFVLEINEKLANILQKKP